MIEHLLIEKGITFIGKKYKFGKTNDVYPIIFNNEEAICKVYLNKYFPEQQEYEKNVLLQLQKLNFPAPIPLSEGIIGNRKYSIFSKMKGKSLMEDIPKDYESVVSRAFGDLHSLNIRLLEHPLDADTELMVQKALTKIDDDKLKKAYGGIKLKTTGQAFCHIDPNFKHIFFEGNLSGVVDFENAMKAPIEIDYASFIRDQIELKRPLKEINNFIKTYPGDSENLANYLARLYILDLGFSHGIRVKSKQRYLNDISLLMSDTNLGNKLLGLSL